MNQEVLFREECYLIQGAVFEVYKEMGCGFLESVYQECLSKELTKREIPFIAQQKLQLSYKTEPLQHYFVADFVCYDAIIIEIKALSATLPEHKSQVLNYLKTTGMHLGLLINFGAFPKVTIERLVL